MIAAKFSDQDLLILDDLSHLLTVALHPLNNFTDQEIQMMIDTVQPFDPTTIKDGVVRLHDDPYHPKKDYQIVK